MPPKCVETLRVLRVILFSVVRCIDDLLGADLTDGEPDIDERELSQNLTTVEKELVDLIFADVEPTSADAVSMADDEETHWPTSLCDQDSDRKSLSSITSQKSSTPGS